MNILKQIAETLEGHWNQGALEGRRGQYCAVGHLCKNLDMDISNFQYDLAYKQDPEFRKAVDLLNKVTAEQFPDRIAGAYSNLPVVNFNDDRRTNEEDVKAVFEKAAVLWDEAV